jgi:hypothetical protein
VVLEIGNAARVRQSSSTEKVFIRRALWKANDDGASTRRGALPRWGIDRSRITQNRAIATALPDPEKMPRGMPVMSDIRGTPKLLTSRLPQAVTGGRADGKCGTPI